MKKSKMRKITYWFARCLTDHECYSVRARTKAEAKQMVANREPGHYGPIVKVTVKYLNPLELLFYIKGEGSIASEEGAAEDAWIARHKHNRDAQDPMGDGSEPKVWP